MPYDLQPGGYVLVGTFNTQDPKATLAAIARALPGKVAKRTYSSQFEISGHVAGIEVKAIAEQAAVCERVVTGIREVTEVVPDPDALAALPKVTVTKTVEDVEWVCRPVMAAAS